MNVTTETSSILSIDEWNPALKPIVDNIEKAIIGKQNVIRLVLIGLLAGGHCLIEDVPGVGKTVLVKATARSLGIEFKRIQFTPDLLPSDVTGISIYNQRSNLFEFRPGPIFGNIVLADEINRTSPKTQSALLEALEEQNVTADGTTYALPDPFMVLATENPIEYEGTFPLPEAQLDRFLLKFSMGYPTLEDELDILSRQEKRHPVNGLEPVASHDDILLWRDKVKEVYVSEDLRKYLVQLVHATRRHQQVYLGASPRATLALYRAAQANAFLANRDYVVPDDIRALIPYVLEHRILLTADARLSGGTVTRIIQDITDRIPVPVLQGANRR